MIRRIAILIFCALLPMAAIAQTKAAPVPGADQIMTQIMASDSGVKGLYAFSMLGTPVRATHPSGGLWSVTQALNLALYENGTGQRGLGLYLLNGGGGLLPASTVANSTLRGIGDGTWVENTNFRADAAGGTVTSTATTLTFMVNALQAMRLTSGTTALGQSALDSLTVGVDNTAIGTNAGTAITNGESNVTVGKGSGATLVSGIDNTIVGTFADTIGLGTDSSVVIGKAATGDSGAVSVGALASAGANGVAIGAGAAALENTFKLVVNGSQAGLVDNLNGTTALGQGALDSPTPLSGLGNTALGENAGTAITTGDFNVLIGFSTGIGFPVSGSQNTLLGYSAATDAENDEKAVAVGASSEAGSSAVAIGYATEAPDGTFKLNVNALQAGVIDGANGTTALGQAALDSLTVGAGIDNTAFGADAGTAITNGDHNTLFGFAAGDSLTTTGTNTLIGSGAGGALAGAVPFAFGNTAIGTNALGGATTGYRNVVVGVDAGGVITTGFLNTLIGRNAETEAADDSTAVAVGTDTVAGTNAVAIGNSASAPDNTIAIAYGGAEQITGTTSTVTFAPGIASSFTSLASTPAALLSGAFFSGGSGTTTFPHFLIQPTGATAATDWSTSGTALGINADVAAGNLMDLKVDGTSAFTVSTTGVTAVRATEDVSAVVPFTVRGGPILHLANLAEFYGNDILGNGGLNGYIDAAGGHWTADGLRGISPAQAAGATAGTPLSIVASNAVAGASVAGAAAGGDVTLTGGDAARLTSGNANGGSVLSAGGTGIGTGSGGPITATAGDGGANGNGGALTFNAGGAGASAGNGGDVSFNGGSAPVDDGGDINLLAGLGYDDGGDINIMAGDTNGLGADPTGGDIIILAGLGYTDGGDITLTPGSSFGGGFEGSVILPKSSTLSRSALRLSGAFFSGGSGTTTFPHFLIQPSGATAATDWNVDGTALGINADSTAVNLIDAKVDGLSKFTTDGTGATVCAATFNTAGGDIRVRSTQLVGDGSDAIWATKDTGAFAFSSGASALSGWDTEMRRASAGEVGITTGTAGASALQLGANGTITGNAVAAPTAHATAGNHTSDGTDVTITTTAAHALVAGQWVGLTGWTWADGGGNINVGGTVLATPTTTTFTFRPGSHSGVCPTAATNPSVVGSITPQGTLSSVAEVTATANVDRGFRREVAADLGSADIVDGVYDNNGTALMTVDGAGGIGVGIADAKAQIEIASAGATGHLRISSNGHATNYVEIARDNITTGALLFLDGSNGEMARITTDGYVVSVGAKLTAATMTAASTGRLLRATHRYDWTNAMVTALGAVTAGDIAIATLPAKTVVTNAYVVITTSAGTVATLNVSIGRTGANYDDLITDSNAKAAANTVYGDVVGERGTNLTGYDLPSFTGTTTLYAHFDAGAENLDTVTTSTGSVYLETMLLP